MTKRPPPHWPHCLGAPPSPPGTLSSPVTQTSPYLNLRSHQNNICVFLACSVFLAERRKGGGRGMKKNTNHEKKQKTITLRDVAQASAHTRQPTRLEEWAARCQHQHWFCSHRSAGNYDNSMFLRLCPLLPSPPLSDFVSRHLPLLKSSPDNTLYNYKVKILLEEYPLMCL